LVAFLPETGDSSGTLLGLSKIQELMRREDARLGERLWIMREDGSFEHE
jgi:hypothetical protein